MGAMRGDRKVKSFRQMRDLHEGGDATAIRHVRLRECHTSAGNQMAEIPYRAEVFAGSNGKAALADDTRMTGDIIGQYSFPRPLAPGDRLVFADMAHYTLVKTNTFNGAPLPDLGVLDEAGNYRVVARFGYEAFRSRLG